MNGVKKTDSMSKNNNRSIITLIVMILFQIVFITVLFGVYKKGFHVDEIWQYSITNGSNGYGIVYESADARTLRNLNEWIPGIEFRELITVQKSELLDYSNIWENAKNDTKGPLGYVPLRFVSGFFLDHFSKWYMFTVNLLSFVLIQFFLFLTVKELTTDRCEALMSCLYYGLCQAGVNTILFLRLYAFETSITMIYIFIWTRMLNIYLKKRESNVKRKNTLLILNCVLICLGGLTDYIFLIFAFVLTGYICLLLLFKKEWKNLMLYTVSSVAGIMLMFFIFPGMIKHFNNELIERTKLWGTSLPLDFSLRIYNSLIIHDMFGFDPSIYHTMTLFYIVWGVFFVFLLFCTVVFLKRKEIDFDLKKRQIRTMLQGIGDFLKKRVFYYVPFILGALAIILLTSKKINIYNMGTFADRYVMIVYPVLSILFIDVLFGVVRAFFRARRVNRKKMELLVLTVFTLTAAGHSLLGTSITYLMQVDEEETIDIKKQFDGADVVLVNTSVGDSAILTEKMQDINYAYFSKIENLDQFEKNPNNDGSDIYIVISRDKLIEFMDEQRTSHGAINTSLENEVKYSQQEIISFFSKEYEAEIENIGTTNLWDYKADVFRVNI